MNYYIEFPGIFQDLAACSYSKWLALAKMGMLSIHMHIVTYQSTSSINRSSSLLDFGHVFIFFWTGQRRAAREGFPSSPRMLEHRRHQQQERQQTQPEEEEEDDDENEDDTGADEFASDDEDSRMGVPGVSQIGISGVTQSPSRNNNDFSRASTSSVSRTATARRAPTFPRARQSMQSRGQQFRINEILSLLETISTHLPIGSHEWVLHHSTTRISQTKNGQDLHFAESFHNCTKLRNQLGTQHALLR